jgi:hypothetical protein
VEKLDLLKKRFWEKANIAGPNECWNWTAGKQTRGYGAFAYRPKKCVTAHRVAWAIENSNGELPDPKLVVMHSCDNKLCVNPKHLSLGTVEENNKEARDRGLVKSIETIVGIPILNKECRHGHERTPENTVFRQKKGKPAYALCKPCLRAKDKRIYDKTPKEVRNARMKAWRAKKHTTPTTPSPLPPPL